MKPASRQVAQLTASSALELPPVFVPIGIEMVRMTSPIRFIVPILAAAGAAAVRSPLLQNALHVAPTAPVIGHRFGDRLLNPRRRVGLERIDEVVGNQRGEQSDVLLVQAKDVRA